MISRTIKGWAVKWHAGPNNVDGKVNEHLLYLSDWKAGEKLCHARHPAFFPTRRAARVWVKEYYGYIAARRDLRRYPHDWRVPRVVPAILTVMEVDK